MTHRQRLLTTFLAAAIAAAGIAVQAQTAHVAPPDAPSTTRVAPPREPGTPLSVSGVIVGPDSAPIPGASMYVYQTDAEGYYGVKPESDSARPRLKAFLRSDARGAWTFETIRPGSYPNSRAPAHIHFEVTATGFAPRFFEIVFEGDPFITADMRHNPGFSVRPVGQDGRVTERIVLSR
jgi:protocatechuate 3,4-dioxygenase beta subunit